MANMSYCRFQNTYRDLHDCTNALEELINNNGVDRYGDKLSQEEAYAAKKMYDLCQEFIDFYEQLKEIEEED